ITDRRQVSFLDAKRDVGTDAGQGNGGVADRDRFRSDHEKPPSRHRNHRITKQARQGERDVEPPETLPYREVETLCGFIEILRYVADRLIHAEGHVPGLAGEDRNT